MPEGPAAASGGTDLRTTLGYCQEYIDLDVQVGVRAPYYKEACTGTWGAEPCARADSIGGCDGPVGDGFAFSLNSWFYVGSQYADGAEMQASCEADGDTWFAP